MGALQQQREGTVWSVFVLWALNIIGLLFLTQYESSDGRIMTGRSTLNWARKHGVFVYSVCVHCSWLPNWHHTHTQHLHRPPVYNEVTHGDFLCTVLDLHFLCNARLRTQRFREKCWIITCIAVLNSIFCVIWLVTLKQLFFSEVLWNMKSFCPALMSNVILF